MSLREACIAIRHRQALRARGGELGSQAGALGAGGRTGRAAHERMRGACGRGSRADVRADARGARHRGWARGLGVLLANGLCTWCTQLVFDPV